MKLFSWMIGEKLSASQSLLWSLLILLSSTAILHSNIIPPAKVTLIYANTLYQLSAAINANLCHTQHFIDPNIRKLKGRKNPIDLNKRLFDLPQLSSPYLNTYCTHHIVDVTTAANILHNRDVEEGLPLYWLYRVIIALFGNITLREVWMLCAALQIALIGPFTFYLLTIGIRRPTVWVVTCLAILINANIFMLAIDVHGFVLPCVLSIIALYGSAARFGLYRRLIANILFLIVVTSLEFWLYYARSSELFALLFLIILYGVFLIRTANSKRAVITLLVVKCLIITLFAWLTAIELGPKAKNETHPVMHMLILGMSDPPNDFAEQQGIKWNDMNNLKFAQEINPKVTVLYTNEYNKAISQYYLRLWKNNTQEMLSLYNLKFYNVIDSLINGLVAHFQSSYGVNVGFLFYPFLLINGYTFIALLGLTVIFLLPGLWHTSANIYYLVLSLTMLALLNLLEGMVIIAVFRYLTTFLFYFVTLAYVLWGTVLYQAGTFLKRWMRNKA